MYYRTLCFSLYAIGIFNIVGKIQTGDMNYLIVSGLAFIASGLFAIAGNNKE